jgi:hypothetical protein
MTDCEGHLRAGIAVHMLLVAGTTVGYVGGVVHLGAIATTAVLLPVTLAGALFPDLDHPSSLPYRYGRHVLPLLAAVVVAVVGVRYRVPIAVVLEGKTIDSLGSFLSGIIVASLGWGAWAVGYVLFPMVRPPHRTVMHRVPTGVVAALCVGGVVSLLIGGHGTLGAGERVLIISSSGTFLLGVLSHLVADGLLLSGRQQYLPGYRDD